jgi:pSer/pThr/pTyr-binding forkhead associated (FHA) protein
VFALQPGDNLIGRPPRQGLAPAIPLDDPAQFISRHHAVIRVEGQTCAVIDQGSDNGTYLNRRRLQPREPYPLRAEDVIIIEGRELRLLVS